MVSPTKLSLALALAIAGSAFASVGPAQAGVFKDRLHYQQHRIGRGVGNGSLTPHEAARLERQEGRLSRERTHLTANGLSRRDRFVLDRRFDRESARIYHQEHDAQRNSF